LRGAAAATPLHSPSLLRRKHPTQRAVQWAHLPDAWLLSSLLPSSSDPDCEPSPGGPRPSAASSSLLLLSESSTSFLSFSVSFQNRRLNICPTRPAPPSARAANPVSGRRPNRSRLRCQSPGRKKQRITTPRCWGAALLASRHWADTTPRDGSALKPWCPGLKSQPHIGVLIYPVGINGLGELTLSRLQA
jgi:hypothetical protein